MRFGEAEGRVAKLDAEVMPVLKVDETEEKIQFRLLPKISRSCLTRLCHFAETRPPPATQALDIE